MTITSAQKTVDATPYDVAAVTSSSECSNDSRNA